MTQMEVPIEAPLPIKKGIAKRLQRSGALKRIERKIKLGMMVAVEELREDPNSPGHLERKKFMNASPYELRALEAVYNFLSERNVTYTLSALIEESAVPRRQSESASILNFIENRRTASQRAYADRADRIEPDEEEDEDDSALLVKAASGRKGALISRRTFGRNALAVSLDEYD
jgi:hypothetical protein